MALCGVLNRHVCRRLRPGPFGGADFGTNSGNENARKTFSLETVREIWRRGGIRHKVWFNTRISGEAVRAYSVAKTVEYRRKIDNNVLLKAVEEGLLQSKCTRERLLHFARVCRVEKLVRSVSAAKLNTCSLQT